MRCEVIIEIFVKKNYNSNCTEPNSNLTVLKSNILLLIFKVVPDHDHLIKTVTKFYIKIFKFFIKIEVLKLRIGGARIFFGFNYLRRGHILFFKGLNLLKAYVS
jgi:hypothetical protein